MSIIDHLIRAADNFEAATGRKRSSVSTVIFNDGKRLDAIAGGRLDPRVGTVAKALQWFSDHWPADAAWPDEVPRPTPSAPTLPAPDPAAPDLPDDLTRPGAAALSSEVMA